MACLCGVTQNGAVMSYDAFVYVLLRTAADSDGSFRTEFLADPGRSLSAAGHDFNLANLGSETLSLPSRDEAVEEEIVLECSGFYAPMDDHPVTANGNRVFPLKMELFDSGGFEITGAVLLSPPVVDVMFTPSPMNHLLERCYLHHAVPWCDSWYEHKYGGEDGAGGDDIDFAGHGSSGNQFVYTDEGIWQFNLKSKRFKGNGTYAVTALSGDEAEYTIDPLCVTSFSRK